MLQIPRRRLGTAAQKKITAPFDAAYDVIVVGSGAGGLTAAVTAAKKYGLKVLVTEKSKYFGGTTAYSGGGCWVPNNHYLVEQGGSDSKEKAASYIRSITKELYNERIVRTYIDNSPKMAKWIEDNTALQFVGLPLPDFHTSNEGATLGRTLGIAPFDGRQLGSRLKDIRYVLQGFKAFDSMQIALYEPPIMTHPFASVGNLSYVIRKLQRYLLDKMRYGKGSFLAGGNALVGSLVHTLSQHGTDLWNNAPAVHPIIEGGRVEGLVIARDGGTRPVRVRAQRAVVLASGGLGHSTEARSFVPHEFCVSPSSVTGDGIRIGREAGAVLSKPNPDNAIFVPVSVLKPKDGPLRKLPHFGNDRGKPGSIIVDSNGERFINESEGYHQFVQKMHDLNMDRCFMIGDKRFLSKYGMGFALPDPYPKWRIFSTDYLTSAQTISQLAAKIGVPEENLVRTVQLNNEYVAQGKDRDFGRGDNPYDHVFGDPTHKPSSVLGTCEKPPFYAITLYPGNASTMYGLWTDEHARALGPDGKPIKGLYAAGNDNNSIWRGAYPAGGSSIGPAMTFGFTAAEHIGSTGT